MISYFNDKDKWFVDNYVLSLFEGPVVAAEIGNLTGNSTNFFAERLGPESTFYSVDVSDHDIIVPDFVKRVNSCSLDWDVSFLDFIYIDGNHEVEHVKKELAKYSQVTDVIAGHDGGQIREALHHHMITYERRIEFISTNDCTSWVMYHD